MPSDFTGTISGIQHYRSNRHYRRTSCYRLSCTQGLVVHCTMSKGKILYYEIVKYHAGPFCIVIRTHYTYTTSNINKCISSKFQIFFPPKTGESNTSRMILYGLNQGMDSYDRKKKEAAQRKRCLPQFLLLLTLFNSDLLVLFIFSRNCKSCWVSCRSFGASLDIKKEVFVEPTKFGISFDSVFSFFSLIR